MHTPFQNRLSLLVCCLSLAVCSFLAVSCTTLGETRLASSIDSKNIAQVDDLESAIPSLIASQDRAARQNIERTIRGLLDSALHNGAYRARLIGLLAELAWIFGEPAYLYQAIREMSELNPAEPWLIIARSRVAETAAERAKILDAAIAENPEWASPYLYLERAQVASVDKRFRDAAAAYDHAFTLLSEKWIAAFQKKRDQAYSLIDASKTMSSRELQWLGQEKVDYSSLVGLSLLKTPFLDRFGKENTLYVADIVANLQRDGYFDKKTVQADAPVNRQTMAFFLSRILAIQENKPDLPTSKKVYTTSPVPDVSLDSPAFRAILILVQREIMNLPDGVNFRPLEIAITRDLVVALNKLNELYR